MDYIKMIFFDLDDCVVASSPPLQKMVNDSTPFKNNRLEELEYNKSMSKYALDYNIAVVSKAEAEGEKPHLIGSIKTGSNDIFKASVGEKIDELEKEKNRIIRWYKNPIELAKRIYEKACWELEMFKEERDHFLEEDNKKSYSEGIIRYEKIFTEKNVIPGAREMINIVAERGEYGPAFMLTHHNGGREEIVKGNFVKKECPKVTFLGLRFHAERYKKGVRRGRNSKALFVMRKFGLPSLEGCVLVDDSLENLDEWAKYGGIAVLYRPLSDDEAYFNRINDHARPYPRITNMEERQLYAVLVLEEYKRNVKKI